MIGTLPYTREHGDVWLRIADLVRPRERVRPSVWAEANIKLSAEVSPSSPGPFRCSYLPWTRAVHDLMFDNPTKRGVIAVKTAQLGFSTAMLNVLGCYCVSMPGPFLFLTSDTKKALKFSSELFTPMVRDSEALKRIFGDVVKDQRSLLGSRPYLGGRIDFVGGGTAADVASWPFLVVVEDELEIVYDNFPVEAGDPVKFGQKRLETVKDIGQFWTFSHPRRKDYGIWPLYEKESDMRAWMFDCPRCGAAVDPTWKCVHIEGLEEAGPMQLEFGRVDPSKAVFRCPICKGVITDAERCRATWAPPEGGTGRLVSRLTPEKALQRDYVGVHIDGLANPTVTVGALVKELAGCNTEEKRRTFFNLTLGETYEASEVAVTYEHVRERLEESRKTLLVPGGRMGAAFLAFGGDLQAPKHNPTIYGTGECYGPFATKFVTHLDRISGWDALQEYLEHMEVSVAHESGNGVGGRLGCSIATIDCGWETAQALDFCRRDIWSKVSGAKIILLPVRYQAAVKRDMPARMPSEQKRIDPARPHLGPMERFDLNRHHWVDRIMRRWQSKRIHVLCNAPQDLAAHITANTLRPVETQHGYHSDEMEWVLIKDARDDWMQASAYCEAGAVLRMEADLLMERASLHDAPAQESTGGDGGWFDRFSTGRRWFGG